jgi:hypothetical protein
MSILNELIDQETGEIDRVKLGEAAALRAASEYGSPNFPPSYLRDSLAWCRDRATIMRAQWRRAHGLPDDTVYVTMNVPEWGASGDSFGGAR